MAEFYSVINALGPVFALVIIGYGCRRLNFPGEGFWPLAERFVYYLLFPSLLVYKLATTPLRQLDLSEAMTAIVALLVISSLLALLLAKLLKMSAAATSSFYQGGVRFNTYVGLAAAAELFGDTGLLWGALFLAVMIPLVNVACIGVFAVVGSQQGGSRLASLVSGLLKNPLIIACMVGIALNLTGVGLPLGVEPVLALLSPVALPLGLLAVGVGLDLKALSRGGINLWLCCLFKLVLYPLLFLAIARTLDLDVTATQVLLVFALLPTAPTAYILARQLGGDAPMMAAVITLQTLLAMVTMPAMLLLLN
ncbi:MAG: AEC family transporter [Motiliproteus sp.]|nr:AEC family transporter [Motiliproteus sp.]MCW9051360.1 AEC family transporter [Motiliproteus sp.]